MPDNKNFVPTYNPFAKEEEGLSPLKLTSGQKNPYDKYRSRVSDTKTPQGLYDLATEAGLEEEAKKMVKRSGGEDMKFLSGGFIMDAMDWLNVASYGVVGLVKGEGFIDGVKNRETLADDDSLGKHGFLGKVAGFVGDILLDPFTYIAPIKVVTKIPGMTKLASSAKSKMIGELETITVQGQKSFQRDGGWKPIKMLGDKLVYGFAVSKEYINGIGKIAGKNDAMMGEADELIRGVSKIDPKIFARTTAKDPTGRMMSTPLDELEISMKRDGLDAEFEQIKEVYAMRDKFMQRLIDLNVISKETADEHWGTYLKQSYDEYLDYKQTLPKKGVALDNKKRLEDLTPEMMKDLGQVEDAGVLWATTLIKQAQLIKTAETQKFIADGYAMTEDMLSEFVSKGGRRENLHLVPDAPAYRLSGTEASLKKSLGTLNKEIKTILKKRKVAFRDNQELTSTISKIEKEMDRLRTATGSDIGEALSGVRQLLRDAGLSQGPMKKVPTSKGQKAVADVVGKWLRRGTKRERLERETLSTQKLLDEMIEAKDGMKFGKTPEGTALLRAFEDPQMMYQWNSPLEFLDAIRYPDRAKVLSEAKNEVVELSEAAQLAKLQKAEKQARRYGSLEQQREILSGTNLKMVENIVNKLEDEYADMLFEKSKLLEALELNRYGSLAGKYVSKDIWDTVKGTFDPTREIGEKFVLHFKHAKVIWNPGSHVRNAFSAAIQNWWKMGLGPWRLDAYYDAHREFKTNGKFLQEMKEMGFSERSGYMNELVDNYLTNKELIGKAMKLQGAGSIKKFGKHVDRMFQNSYGHVDNVAKVAAYKAGLKKGLSKEEAYANAMAATFNYSEVTPFVHQMRRAIWGVPFITFALKAAPLTAETLAKSPGKISVFGKARNSLFQAAGIEAEQEAEAMPDYMRDDMFVMRLPWKDANGRSMYFDLSYIIPFGAIADGSLLKEPHLANPVIGIIRELSRNETFSGSKIFNESDDADQVIVDIAIHTMKLGLPGPVTDFLPDGYNSDGTRKTPKMGWGKLQKTNTQDLGPGERSFYQEAARLLGVGAVPYELNSKESALAYKQNENLTRMLQENGILKTLEAGYLPKDSELRPENRNSFGGPIYDRETRPIGR